MSRSALWHQEKNHQQRQQRAEEIYENACEEGRSVQHGKLVPMWNNCDDTSFHLNAMLLQNIIHSPYFMKTCQNVHDWNTLIDEIYYHVKHVEPFGSAAGGARGPSTAFCLLLRLMTLRCTEKQMKLMLVHEDSPYIRATGFLYLRYLCDPYVVWNWIEPYLFDTEPIQVRANGGNKSGNRKGGGGGFDSIETIGEFVRFLFTTRDFFGTVLPRFPVPLEREMKVKLLQAEKIQDRAKQHMANEQNMKCFQTVGSKVLALYGDDENPITWYHAVIDRVITSSNSEATSSSYPSFIVTFPEYGNTETVSLGELDMLPASGSTNNDNVDGRSHRGYDDDYDRRKGGRDDDDDRCSRRGGGRDYDNDRYRDRGYGDRKGRGYSRDRDDDRYRDYDRDRDYHHRGGGERARRRGYDDHDDDDYGDRDRHHRRHNSRSTSPLPPAPPREEDLYEEVRRRERENVTASGRDFSRRPVTTKSALSAPVGSSSSQHHHRRKQQRHSPSPPRNNMSNRPSSTAAANDSRHDNDTEIQPKKRTAEQIAATEVKKRKLLAKYG